MEYYVKIGKMYLSEFGLHEDFLNTNFLRNLDLSADKEEALLIREDEKEELIKLLETLFDMEYTLRNYIKFEEVEADE